MIRVIRITLRSACLICLIACAAADDADDPAAVFAQRLMPIFQSEKPSSCVQCHLSGVDLKDYILPSSRDTFLSLRQRGLINTDSPEDSKILQLISMGDSDPDAKAARIHARNRQREYDAFAHWIKACCDDEALLTADLPETEAGTGPGIPLDLIRHTRKDRVLDSFVRNVWSQRMRCFPCHTPNELNPENPLHEKPIQRHREFVEKYGQKMNIFRTSPTETMRALVAGSGRRLPNRLPLVNLEEPHNSLLLQKPTARLPARNEAGDFEKPSSQLPVSHMGGIKMHKNDHSWKAILSWVQDYSASVSNEYQSREQLPSDNWYPTEHVIRVKGLPDSWPKMRPVQIFVHRWNDRTARWEDTPVAFTQTLVTPRRLLNGTLFRLAQPQERAALNPVTETLTPGKVQLRLYLDQNNVLSDAPSRLLNDRPADATATVTARFRKGFRNADIVDGVQQSSQKAGS